MLYITTYSNDQKRCLQSYWMTSAIQEQKRTAISLKWYLTNGINSLNFERASSGKIFPRTFSYKYSLVKKVKNKSNSWTHAFNQLSWHLRLFHITGHNEENLKALFNLSEIGVEQKSGGDVFQGGYHPRETKHVIRVVFQDQAMHAHTSLGCKNIQNLKEKVYFWWWSKILGKKWQKINKKTCKNVFRVCFHTWKICA